MTQENRIISSAEAMMLEGEEAYTAMAENVFEQAEKLEFTPHEFRRAIEQVILSRNRKFRPGNNSAQAMAKFIKVANAKFVITNYFHDNFFTIAANGPDSHDKIVQMLARALPSPEIRRQNHALTNAKNSPVLSFEQGHYLDERKEDTGLRIWVMVIRRKGETDKVIMLPPPDNVYMSDVYENIDARCAERNMFLAVPSVNNYIEPLFDVE